jgi:hypothetical protein
MMRVQATSAVLDTRIRTIVAFMNPPKQLPPLVDGDATFRPSSGRELAGNGGFFHRAHGLHIARPGGAMAQKDKVEGEGSYTGSKDYNERTRKFVDSGKVADAARKAQPKNDQEKHAMQKAERIGKEKAKGEDPALRDPKKIPDDPFFPRKK